MTDALAKVYNQQQQAIAIKNQREQAAKEKRQREINAFHNSGIPALYIELADVPLVYQPSKKFAEMTYSYCDPRKKANLHEMTFSRDDKYTHSGGSWWCEESPDTGRMRYCNRINSNTHAYATPDGPWFDSFIEYVAKVCDPAAIAQLHGEPGAAPPAKSGKRKLQPIN